MKEKRSKEEKIQSVKFTSPIKGKINVASRARSPKAIIFEIQGPPAHSWKPEDYLFMVSPLEARKKKPGKDEGGYV